MINDQFAMYVSRRFISQIEEYAGSNKHQHKALKRMPVDIPI
jgi:hypothetical protein